MTRRITGVLRGAEETGGSQGSQGTDQLYTLGNAVVPESRAPTVQPSALRRVVISEPEEQVPSAEAPSVSGEIASQEPKTSLDNSRAQHKRIIWINGALFFVGLAVAQAGLQLARSRVVFPFISDDLRRGLSEYIDASIDSILVGGLVAALGAAIAGLAARKALPDLTGAMSMPVPRLQFDLRATIALVLATFLTYMLYWHITHAAYTHWDIALFFGSLALAGYSIHRLDPKEGSPRFQFDMADGPIAALLACFAGIIGSIDLTRWNFAYIGDEGAFFDMARLVALGQRPWNFFDLVGVYTEHPVLDSVYQAFVMQRFGISAFGWRFSEVLMTCATVALLYLLGRALLGRWPGVAAAIMLGSSHYLMAANRIAKTHQQEIFYEVLIFLMLVLAWRTQRAVFTFATGAAMGFCLYTFLGSVLMWPTVAILLLISFVRRPSWRMLLAGVIMVIAFLMVVTPGLLTSGIDHVIRVATQNSRREMAAIDPLLVARVSVVQSFLIHWVNFRWFAMYVGGTLVDTLTGLLLWVGLGICLFRINKRAERLAFVWFVGGIVMQASLNYQPQPQLTRLFYATPAAALIASITVEKVIRVLRGNFRVPQGAAVATAFLPLVLVPLLNLNQLLVESPKNIQGNLFSMMVKQLQTYQHNTIVEVGNEQLQNGNLVLAIRWYPELDGHYQYLPVAQFDEARITTVDGGPPIYFIDNRNQELAPWVQAKLPRGYTLDVDVDPTGTYKVWLFIPNTIVSRTAAK